MKGAKAVHQERSRKTRDKLVAALERLLKQKPFEKIAITELSKEAGVSVGAVYNRFENKDAFIPVLFELYKARHEAYMLEAQSAEPASDLRGALQQSMVSGWRFLIAESHLLRAVHLYSRLRPDLVGDYWDEMLDSATASLLAGLEHYRGQIAVKDLQTTAELLTYYFNTVLVEAALYKDTGIPAPKSLSGDDLARELADFAWAYLTRSRE